MSLQRSTGREQKEDRGNHEQRTITKKLRGESFMNYIGTRLKADGKKTKV